MPMIMGIYPKFLVNLGWLWDIHDITVVFILFRHQKTENMFKMTKYQQTGMLLCCYVKWYLLTYSYKWSFQAAPEFIMPLPYSVSRLHGSNISVKPFTLHPSPRPKNVSKEFNHLHLSPLRASSTLDFSHNIFIFWGYSPVAAPQAELDPDPPGTRTPGCVFVHVSGLGFENLATRE